MESENIFKPIKMEKPSDLVINQIKYLIQEGKLKPGDKLPPERQLSEQFKVSRSYVREAIKQLELYGIVTTRPQSGSVISSLGVQSLFGFIKTALGDKQEFHDLMEVRQLLEVQSAVQAAKRAKETDLKKIDDCHKAFCLRTETGEGAVEQDLAFHLAIADASENRVLRTFLGIITPDIIHSSREGNSWTEGRIKKAIHEHDEINRAIRNHDMEGARSTMEKHMNRTLENFKEKGIF